jgi:soluble lytic murein transglycosylase-like protein
MRGHRPLNALFVAVAALLVVSSPSPNALADDSSQTDLVTLAHATPKRPGANELEILLAEASSPDEKAQILLALADVSFREGSLERGRPWLDQAQLLRGGTKKETRQMIDIFQAQMDSKRGDYDAVRDTLARWSERSVDSPFHPIIARLYFRALVRNGSPLQATSYFRRYQQTLTTPLSPAIEEDLIGLVDKLDIQNSSEAITALNTLLLANFPFTNGSREAFVRLSGAECLDDAMRQDTWQTTELREQIAKRLVRDYGVRPDLRQLGLALMRVSESEMVPDVPVDTLPMEQKAELFKRAEQLQSAWEYQQTFRILDYLVQAREYDADLFPRDKVLLAIGRTLNQLERYGEAADYYSELLRNFKGGRSAKLAKERFQLSLHYARRYDQEIAFLKSLETRRGPIENLWNLFWAQYLNHNDNDALATARRFLERTKRSRNSKLTTRAHFWIARLHERMGATDKARQEYERLAQEAATSHYSTLSRWRLDTLSRPPAEPPPPAVPPALLAASATTEEDEAAPGNERLATPVQLSRVGLSEFARLLFGFQLPRRIDHNSLLGVSRAAVNSERYKLGISLVDPYVSEALSKGISESRLRENLTQLRAAWTVAFPRPYSETVEKSASILGIGAGLVYSIVRTESLFNPEAVSNVGALGLMQIMPRTGLHISRLLADTEYNTPLLAKENLNLVYGSWYLRRLTRYYRGNFLLAIAAYNAGPLAVDRWIRQNPTLELDEFLENIPYDQTYAYVPKVMNYMNIYSRLYGEKQEPLTLTLPRELPKPDTSLEIF